MKIKKFNDVYKRFLILFIKLCREVLFEINTIINCTKKSKLLKKIRIFPCSLLPISRMEEKRKIQITDLPVDIFRLISLFVSVNKLTSTCRDLFFGVKPQLYLSLNKTHSLKYYEDEAFRALVHSRIENISLQLSLNLSYCGGITDVSALCEVHTLDLSCCSGITDVSALGRVHTLDFSDCTRITDVSALGGVHTLNLTDCPGITDVSALGGVHTLDLSYCFCVSDVSALGGVHTLTLRGCYGITDVSALRRVSSLTLIGCNGITDVSALGGVHTLDLSGCRGITDVRALSGVHTLIFERFRNLGCHRSW